MSMDFLTDRAILVLYRYWSEETYCAGFMDPAEDAIVQSFVDWLRDSGASNADTLTFYEIELLLKFRRMVMSSDATSENLSRDMSRELT